MCVCLLGNAVCRGVVSRVLGLGIFLGSVVCGLSMGLVQVAVAVLVDLHFVIE